MLPETSFAFNQERCLCETLMLNGFEEQSSVGLHLVPVAAEQHG